MWLHGDTYPNGGQREICNVHIQNYGFRYERIIKIIEVFFINLHGSIGLKLRVYHFTIFFSSSQINPLATGNTCVSCGVS